MSSELKARLVTIPKYLITSRALGGSRFGHGSPQYNASCDFGHTALSLLVADGSLAHDNSVQSTPLPAQEFGTSLIASRQGVSPLKFVHYKGVRKDKYLHGTWNYSREREYIR